MTQWELKVYNVDIEVDYQGGLWPSPSSLWTKKHKETGKTSWDELKELAADGWELVSVTPIAVRAGSTASLLYTFKRPKT